MVNTPMAYRRKAGVARATTIKEEAYHHQQSQLHKDDQVHAPTKSSSPHHQRTHSDGGGSSSLAARAIRASAAHRDASAYGYANSASASDPSMSFSLSSLSPSFSSRAPSTLTCSSSVAASSLRDPSFFRSYSFPEKGCYESDSPSKDNNESQYGFWGILASKAKSILQEDDFQTPERIRSLVIDPSSGPESHQYSYQSSEGGNKVDSAKLRKRLDAVTSSLSNLGDTLGNAFEEGHAVVKHKSADIIQETHNKTTNILQENRKIQIRRRGSNTDTQDQATVIHNTSWQRPVLQPVQTNSVSNQDTQLKVSRDVAMATAAKAKVLLRELKTVKADLAFAKERCSQLEEENKRLRESRVKGNNPADDDLIRLQLETLLAEKARLGHENSVYARENRFLREIVEYHQLTMQDVVYLDDGSDEIADAYPFCTGDKVLCSTPTSPASPSFFQEISSLNFTLPLEMKEYPPEEHKDECNTTTSQLSQPRSPTERKESAHDVSSSQRTEDEHDPTFISQTPTSN